MTNHVVKLIPEVYPTVSKPVQGIAFKKHTHISVRLLHTVLVINSITIQVLYCWRTFTKTIEYRHKVCTAVKSYILNESRAWPESHWKWGCEINSCCIGLPMAALTFSWMSFLHCGLLCQSEHIFVLWKCCQDEHHYAAVTTTEVTEVRTAVFFSEVYIKNHKIIA